ncbi:MAG TPA: cupin domain-containing protein [Bryobacteraceae bacterium]|nr:cupin domain-containing protein [Bryobacteraceae bacterium]
MDPLSQVLGLLKPQAIGWRVIEAYGAWTINFRPANIVAFGQMIEGSCHVEREDGIRFDLDTGDFVLMTAPPNWTMETLGGGEPVDFKALVDDPRLLVPSANSSVVTRL